MADGTPNVAGIAGLHAGVQWVMDAEDSARSTADSPVRLRVNNSADAGREQFQLRWAGITGGVSLDAYVPPGQSRIVPAPKLPTACGR